MSTNTTVGFTIFLPFFLPIICVFPTVLKLFLPSTFLPTVLKTFSKHRFRSYHRQKRKSIETMFNLFPLKSSNFGKRLALNNSYKHVTLFTGVHRYARTKINRVFRTKTLMCLRRNGISHRTWSFQGNKGDIYTGS